MSKSPKVSIVTITYNQENYIREALDSFVMQQTDFAFDVIVADDCSTDKTPEIIKEYAKAHPQIFKPILREKNIGAVANSISALQAATGDYIALCEGDDYWTDPNKLQTQADYLDGNADYALCFHPVKVVFESEEKKSYIYPNTENASPFTVNKLLKENFIQTNAVMYKKQDYGNIPKNIMPLDWYLHLYHAQFGKIGFIPKVMSVYRRHQGGVWWDSYENMEEIWKKHGLPHLNLFIEFLKLYAGDPECRKIINESLDSMFNDLVTTDKKEGLKLLEKSLRDFHNNSELSIIIQHLEHEDKLRDHIEEQAKIINHLNDKLTDLDRQFEHAMEELSKVTAELNEIKNSRAWKSVERLAKIKGKLKI